jgi:3-mercaptopyruvate sulfurtransferase SseA
MKKSSKKKTFFALLIGAALVSVILSACTPASPQAEPEGPVAEAPGEVQRVSIEESKAAFDSGEAVFLDVRSESSYAANHIPGALSMPLSEVQTRIGELDPNQWIITYCT